MFREVNESAAEAIMKSVRDTIATYPFLLKNLDEQVRILPGIQEGTFAWIATNYLSGNLGVCICFKLSHCETRNLNFTAVSSAGCLCRDTVMRP